MRRYLLTDSARGDLLRIVDYVRQRSPRAAGELYREFRAAMRQIAQFPNMGHHRPDLADRPLRVWSVRKFLIIYLADHKPLTIIRVVHGAQDMEKLFDPA